MPVTIKNVLSHELIGLKTKILGSSDPGLRNARGIVLDETKNTLTIQLESRKLIVPKSHTVFLFHVDEQNSVRIEGESILGRPHDRIRAGQRR